MFSLISRPVSQGLLLKNQTNPLCMSCFYSLCPLRPQRHSLRQPGAVYSGSEALPIYVTSRRVVLLEIWSEVDFSFLFYFGFLTPDPCPSTLPRAVSLSSDLSRSDSRLLSPHGVKITTRPGVQATALHPRPLPALLRLEPVPGRCRFCTALPGGGAPATAPDF